MNAITKTDRPANDVLADVILNGDLARLTPDQKVIHYNAVCESVGLNPLTKPFEYLKLNGKELLYARKDCSDQLRKIHNVTLTILDKRIEDDLFVVTVRASFPSGRSDEDMGAVLIGALRGEARANAIMKAITKAKRRVTLSACGLGWLDESETESLPGQHREPPHAGTTIDAAAEPARAPLLGGLVESMQRTEPKLSAMDRLRVKVAGCNTKGDVIAIMDDAGTRTWFGKQSPADQADMQSVMTDRMAELPDHDAEAVDDMESAVDGGQP